LLVNNDDDDDDDAVSCEASGRCADFSYSWACRRGARWDRCRCAVEQPQVVVLRWWSSDWEHVRKDVRTCILRKRTCV
jgi:hypothetical protein